MIYVWTDEGGVFSISLVVTVPRIVVSTKVLGSGVTCIGFLFPFLRIWPVINIFLQWIKCNLFYCYNFMYHWLFVIYPIVGMDLYWRELLSGSLSKWFMNEIKYLIPHFYLGGNRLKSFQVRVFFSPNCPLLNNFSFISYTCIMFRFLI